MITLHARQRIENRLRGIVSKAEIAHIESVARTLGNGKYYVRVKQFATPVYLDDSRGDCVTFIVNNGNVVTGMLSFRTQTWKDGKLLISLA